MARHQRLADEAPGRDAARKATEHVQLCRRREESRLDQIVIPDITCAIYATGVRTERRSVQNQKPNFIRC